MVFCTFLRGSKNVFKNISGREAALLLQLARLMYMCNEHTSHGMGQAGGRGAGGPACSEQAIWAVGWPPGRESASWLACATCEQAGWQAGWAAKAQEAHQAMSDHISFLNCKFPQVNVEIGALLR